MRRNWASVLVALDFKNFRKNFGGGVDLHFGENSGWLWPLRFVLWVESCSLVTLDFEFFPVL